MKRHSTKIICLTALVVTAASAEVKLSFFQGLFSPDDAARSQAVAQARTERSARVEELISIVQHGNDDAPVGGSEHSAILLLGEYRATEAVPILAEHLLFLPKPGRLVATEMLETSTYYPCAAALVKIGQPSGVVRLMLRKIALSPQEQERNLAAWVMMKIQGKEQALAAIAVRAETVGSEDKLKLQSAANYIRKYRPSFGYPQTQ